MFHTCIAIIIVVFVFMAYKNWRYISVLDQISFSVIEVGGSTEAEVRFINQAIWNFRKHTQPLMNNVNLSILILFISMILNVHHYNILLVNLFIMLLWCSLYLAVVFIMERTDHLTESFSLWSLIALAHILNIVLCVMTVAFLLTMILLEG